MNIKNSILLVLSLCFVLGQIYAMETDERIEEQGEGVNQIEGDIVLHHGIFGSLTLNGVGPNSNIIVGGTLPEETLIKGSGFARFAIGPVVGNGSSSGLVGHTTRGTEKYNFVVNLQIPVTFALPYHSLPNINISVNNQLSSLNGIILKASTLHTTTVSTIINLKFKLTAEGIHYQDALIKAEREINNIIQHGISVHLLAEE